MRSGVSRDGSLHRQVNASLPAHLYWVGRAAGEGDQVPGISSVPALPAWQGCKDKSMWRRAKHLSNREVVLSSPDVGDRENWEEGWFSLGENALG